MESDIARFIRKAILHDRKVKLIKICISLLLLLSGYGILWICISWKLALGIFIIQWGENLYNHKDETA
jgi:hypothetical protein